MSQRQHNDMRVQSLEGKREDLTKQLSNIDASVNETEQLRVDMDAVVYQLSRENEAHKMETSLTNMLLTKEIAVSSIELEWLNGGDRDALLLRLDQIITDLSDKKSIDSHEIEAPTAATPSIATEIIAIPSTGPIVAEANTESAAESNESRPNNSVKGDKGAPIGRLDVREQTEKELEIPEEPKVAQIMPTSAVHIDEVEKLVQSQL